MTATVIAQNVITELAEGYNVDLVDMTKSKRFWLSMIVFFSFIALSWHGINKGTDLYGLCAIIAAITVHAGTYMWNETKRPSGTITKENES